MEFKKLRGNRVFLNIPNRKKSSLIIPEEAQASLDEEWTKEFSLHMKKAEVYAVGDLVTDIQPGDKVLVDPEALKRAVVIHLTDTKDVALVSPFDIIMVW